MTPVLRPVAAGVLAAGLIVAGAAAQNQPQTTSPQTAAQKPVAVIGCVERVLPAGNPTGTLPPVQQSAQTARMYKLIDTQPGGGSPVTDRTGRVISTPKAEAPEIVEPQYWLSAPATIDLAKYQNQRVEIIGTLTTEQKPATVGAESAPQDVPKSTLTASNVRVISTECKGNAR